MQDQGADEQHQENEKQDLRDAGGRRRDSAETEYRGYNGDDKKHQGPVKHIELLPIYLFQLLF
jgi:hypothetical protein